MADNRKFAAMRAALMAVAALCLQISTPSPAAQIGEDQIAEDDGPQLSPAQRAARAERFKPAHRQLEPWTSPTLTPFRSEKDIRRWLEAARRAEHARPLLDEDDPIMLVHGRRWPHRSAPHVAMPAIDEGDLVRTAGRFLLILHDGQLLSIDTAGGAGRDLVLADRTAPGGPAYPLYDELLVDGDRVIVTGYSNAASSVLISTFRLGPDGRLAREGIFLLTSPDDYETALAGGNLVVHLSTDAAYWGGSTPDFTWPTLRRWDQAIADRPAPPATGDEEEDYDPDWVFKHPASSPPRPLLGPSDIFRPVAATMNGEVQIVAVCPLPAHGPIIDLSCRSTGLAAPILSAFAVSGTAAFLATTQTRHDARWLDRACPARADSPWRGRGSLLYRIPFTGEAPAVSAIAGSPLELPDRPFAVRDGNVHLLLEEAALGCGGDVVRAYVDVPPAAFATGVTSIDASAFTALRDRYVDQVVFDERHVAAFNKEDYLGRDESELTILALGGTGGPVELSIPHAIDRAEPIAGGLLLSGPTENERRRVSFVALDDRIRPAVTLPIPEARFDDRRRYVSAAARDADGAVIIAVPIDRHPPAASWLNLSVNLATRFPAPDIHFFRLDRNRRFRPLGALRRQVDDGPDSPGRACHAPCLPWFEHSRAIFVDGRIFALAGVELIEGRIDGGGIVEVRRLNFARRTHPPLPASRP